MATIHKLKKDGLTIFPATITDAVIHPSVSKSLTSLVKEYNVSELFPTEGIDGGNTYNLPLAIRVLGSHLRSSEKNGEIKVTFIPEENANYTNSYYKNKQEWSNLEADWNMQVTLGPEISDPSGIWDPSTAEEYVDQKIAEQQILIDNVSRTSVQVTPQELTEDQKSQVRENIGLEKGSLNGLGIKYLNPTKSFVSQVISPNTVYILYHDFELTENLTIPTGCILEFRGGVLTGNATLTGQQTKLINPYSLNIIGPGIVKSGTFTEFIFSTSSV